MPPKVKITKDDIICVSLDLIRKNGSSALNARNVAEELKCSTQPLFSNFSTMEELQGEVMKAVYELYLDYSKKEVESGKYPQYKSMGMAYIGFAKEEKELFKLLFMCDRRGKDQRPTVEFETVVEMISESLGITKEKAQLMHLEIWMFVHGIATMIATSFLEPELDLISDMLTDVYQGIRARVLSKES